LEHNTTKILS